MSEKNNDQLLRKLFQDVGKVSPSDDFTNRLMQKIGHLKDVTEPIADKRKFERYWIIIGLVGIISIAFLIYYSQVLGLNIKPEDVKSPLIPAFVEIFDNLEQLFNSFKVSTTTIIIILAFSSVFVLDKILNTGKKIMHLV